MPEQPEVRVGQVWADSRGDLKGRRLLVETTDASGNGFTKLVYVRNSDDVQQALDGNPKPEWKRWGYEPTDMCGRPTTMRTSTLRPPRFKFVEDLLAPEVTA